MRFYFYILIAVLSFRIHAGICDNMVFDCQNQTATIGGKVYARGAQCGKDTGKRLVGRKIRIGSEKKASGKRLHNGHRGLRKGTPEIVTYPEVCGGCLIHVGRILKGAVSYGCLHVTPLEFNILRSCKNRGTFTIIPASGRSPRKRYPSEWPSERPGSSH